jgi:organic hydroperoxide reductase OsmC/OhrA
MRSFDMAQQNYFYNTSIEWSTKRRGRLTAEGSPDLIVSTPPEFKGEAGFWTPEHLFVAAAEACLMATFLGIAEISRLVVVSYRSTAKGKLEFVEGSGLRFTEIEIFPAVELEKSEDRERAERIMTKAAKSCLVANSMSATVKVKPEFVFRKIDTAA